MSLQINAKIKNNLLKKSHNILIEHCTSIFSKNYIWSKRCKVRQLETESAILDLFQAHLCTACICFCDEDPHKVSDKIILFKNYFRKEFLNSFTRTRYGERIWTIHFKTSIMSDLDILRFSQQKMWRRNTRLIDDNKCTRAYSSGNFDSFSFEKLVRDRCLNYFQSVYITKRPRCIFFRNSTRLLVQVKI